MLEAIFCLWQVGFRRFLLLLVLILPPSALSGVFPLWFECSLLSLRLFLFFVVLGFLLL